MKEHDEHAASRRTREHREEEPGGDVGVGTDGSLHSTHRTPDDERREDHGVGTDGSLGAHPRDPE